MRPDSCGVKYSPTDHKYDLEHEITMFDEKMKLILKEIKESPANYDEKLVIKKALLDTLIKSL